MKAARSIDSGAADAAAHMRRLERAARAASAVMAEAVARRLLDDDVACLLPKTLSD